MDEEDVMVDKSVPETEMRPQELGFRKASLHDPEEFEKLDKAVRSRSSFTGSSD